MDGVVDVTFLLKGHAVAGLEVTTWRALRAKDLRGHLQRPSRPAFYIILHITEGRARHMLDFQPHDLRKHDSIFICKGQVHQFDLRSRFDAIMILFTEDFLLRHSQRTLTLADNRLFNYHLHPPVLDRSVARSEGLTPLFEALHDEYMRTGDRSPAVLHSWLELLLLKAERGKPETPVARITGRDYAEFLRFTNLVETEHVRTRRAEHYAERMGCSLKTLNALCRRATGRTAKTFIDERTVLEIRRHMSVRDKSVKELAFEMGFEDASNLVKYVKRLTGRTPGELHP